MKRNNVILIGMPGAGKSTVGVVLAKNLGYRFLDSDICIQEQEKMRLHEIISEKGLAAFLEIENRVNASLETEKNVIATGGSAIYGKEAMKHLSEMGTIVYLELPYEEIRDRLGDLSKRGVALKDNQTLLELYEERIPYYEKHANIVINCKGKGIREIVEELAYRINERGSACE